MLNQVIGQHAQSVGRTFRMFGINAPVTESNLAAALVVHKAPFIGALVQDVERYSSNDGEAPATKGQKLKNTLLTVLAAIGGGAAIFGAVKAGGGTATQPYAYAYPPPPVEKKTNWMLILGIAAGVITLTAIIVIASKND